MKEGESSRHLWSICFDCGWDSISSILPFSRQKYACQSYKVLNNTRKAFSLFKSFKERHLSPCGSHIWWLWLVIMDISVYVYLFALWHSQFFSTSETAEYTICPLSHKCFWKSNHLKHPARRPATAATKAKHILPNNKSCFPVLLSNFQTIPEEWVSR